MSFALTDLKLPADKIAQIEKALGGSAGDAAAPRLLSVCGEASADVARLTTGYVLDALSVTNFIRAIALYRAYGYIGTIPKDVEKNYDAAWAELTAIAEGKRKNLPRPDDSTTEPSANTGGWGSQRKIPHGRLPMTSATTNRRSKAEIVDELEAQLTAVMLADEVTPAFQRIERFDVESMTEAFQLLIISEQRICIIVALDEHLTPALDSFQIVITRELPIALLISDRLLGDRVKALWGDSTDAALPGAFALAELALPAVTGQLLDNTSELSGVVCKPTAINSIFLKDADKQNLPGRAAVALELNCIGGTIEARVGPGQTL